MDELEVECCFDCPFYRSEERHDAMETRDYWCTHPDTDGRKIEMPGPLIPDWCSREPITITFKR